MSTPPPDSGINWTLVDRSSRKRRRHSSDVPGPAPLGIAPPDQLSESSDDHVTQEDLPQQPSQEEQDPTIPSYQEAWSSQNNHEDADMLLALQLSFADSDGEDIDLANFDSMPRRRIQGIPMNANGDVGPSQPDSSDELVDEGAQAPLPEYSYDDLTHLRPAPTRDRYDIAGISTYRVDPRGTNSLYRRFLQNSSRIPQVASRSGTEPAEDPAQLKPTPLNPSSFFEAVRRSHPVLDPASGAPMVNVLHRDSFLLVLDYLYFPDIFALAMTCKAVHDSIDLKSKKAQYQTALLSKTQLCDGASAQTSASRRGLCEVCLYDLPNSYFKPRWSLGQKGESSTVAKDERKRPKLEASAVCSDCAEFRERVEAARGSESGSASASNVWVVWRPNHRVTVAETDGFLWYRRRV